MFLHLSQTHLYRHSDFKGTTLTEEQHFVFSQFSDFAPSIAPANFSSSPATFSSHSKLQLHSNIHDRVDYLKSYTVWQCDSREVSVGPEVVFKYTLVSSHEDSFHSRFMC
jgi:hypothetical protein